MGLEQLVDHLRMVGREIHYLLDIESAYTCLDEVPPKESDQVDTEEPIEVPLAAVIAEALPHGLLLLLRLKRFSVHL